jgi:hypothetical protein
MKLLPIEPERILQASKQCPQAREVLETLFPDVFKNDKYFDLSPIVGGTGTAQYRDSLISSNKARAIGLCHLEDGQPAIQVRRISNLKLKGFWLSRRFNWEIVADDAGELVLVPTKKK